MKAIGIDIGTTSISGVVIDCDSLQQLDAHSLANDSAILNTPSWAKEQDPNRILFLCEQLIHTLLSCWPDVQKIGVTGQMHGIVYLDRTGEAVSPLYTWQDERGNLLKEGDGRYAEALSGLTGYPTATGYGLVTYYYQMINQAIPPKAAKLSTIMDFVVMKLCRLTKPVIHPSNAAGLGLFDLKRFIFDPAALKAAGMDPSFLPLIAADGMAVGQTAKGIWVYTAIGDNQAGVYGCQTEETDRVINIGTSSQISLTCDYHASPKALELRPYIQGRYLLIGAGLCGGSALQLFADFFKEVCDMAAPVERDWVYEMMLGAAAKDEGVSPLSVEPYFKGTRADPARRGAILNIGTENLHIGALVNAVYKGISRELHELYCQMPTAISGGGRILVAGNAARKHPLLKKALDEAFGQACLLTPFTEEAAVGAAKYAAVIGRSS